MEVPVSPLLHKIGGLPNAVSVTEELPQIEVSAETESNSPALVKAKGVYEKLFHPVFFIPVNLIH